MESQPDILQWLELKRSSPLTFESLKLAVLNDRGWAVVLHLLPSHVHAQPYAGSALDTRRASKSEGIGLWPSATIVGFGTNLQ